MAEAGRSSRLVRLARAGVLLGLGLAGLAAAPVESAVPAMDHEDRARVEAYLNGLDTLQAKFVQIAPNGEMSTGELYYERPDKMRLDYDPPSRILMIANGWQLVYHDRRLDQVSHLFTSRTPLAFLLEDEIRLDGEVTVTRAERVGEELRITLVQTEEADEGQITLVFRDDPLALERWAVTDAQGLTTHVVLEDLRTGMPLEDSLFVFRDPNRFPRERD